MPNQNLCEFCPFSSESPICRFQTKIDDAKQSAQESLVLIATAKAIGDKRMSDEDTELVLKAERDIRELGRSGCRKALQITLTFDTLRGNT